MKRTNTGLSLAEFTVTVTLLGIAMLLSAPLLYRFANDQRTSRHTNELVLTLNYARAQAITRGQPVTVCSSNDGRQCTDTPWTQGYLVFVDNDSPGVVDATDQVLRHTTANYPKLVITLQGGHYVRFNPLGMLYAQAQSDVTVPSRLARWLDRLSPIASAQAETFPADRSSEQDRVPAAADAVRHGAFIVCYRDIGRKISLSLQGRITTRTASCHKDS
jgi:Tfp pilus assembly protein FimT